MYFIVYISYTVFPLYINTYALDIYAIYTVYIYNLISNFFFQKYLRSKVFMTVGVEWICEIKE